MFNKTLRDALAKEMAATDSALATSAHSPHRRIHRARKALRRARALLALVDRSDPAFAMIDAKLRRAAHSLSALRDAAVAVETLDRLLKRKGLRDGAGAAEPLRDELVRRRDLTLADCRRRDPGFAILRRHLQRMGEAANALQWSRASARTIARGLVRSHRRAVKTGERACHSNEQHLRHRWRRRLRRCNDQRGVIAEMLGPDSGTVSIDASDLLERLSRKGLLEAIDQRAATAHALGLEHDARLLRHILRKTPALDADARAWLLAALDHQLRKLHKRCGK